MDLGYFAADTLGVTLYQIKDTLVSTEIHPMTLGPWQLDLPVDVESDLMSSTELSFWVTLGKRLPLYVIIRGKECWLLVLNRAKVQQCEVTTGFDAETVKERIHELKPAIAAVFRWSKDKDEWAKMEYAGAPQEGG